MKHQRDIQYPVKQGTLYPFDVSVRALYKTNRNQFGFGVIAAAAAAQTC